MLHCHAATTHFLLSTPIGDLWVFVHTQRSVHAANRQLHPLYAPGSSMACRFHGKLCFVLASDVQRDIMHPYNVCSYLCISAAKACVCLQAAAFLWCLKMLHCLIKLSCCLTQSATCVVSLVVVHVQVQTCSNYSAQPLPTPMHQGLGFHAQAAPPQPR